MKYNIVYVCQSLNTLSEKKKQISIIPVIVRVFFYLMKQVKMVFFSSTKKGLMAPFFIESSFVRNHKLKRIICINPTNRITLKISHFVKLQIDTRTLLSFSFYLSQCDNVTTWTVNPSHCKSLTVKSKLKNDSWYITWIKGIYFRGENVTLFSSIDSNFLQTVRNLW